MTNMFMEDYGILRQEDGYLSGICDKVGELNENECKDTWERMEEIADKWHIPFIHKKEITTDDVNYRLLHMIETFKKMNDDDIKKVIFAHIREIHIRQGEQQKAWEHEYWFESSQFDHWAQNRADMLKINIQDLMDFDQYEDELIDPKEDSYYDCRGNAICNRLVEYLEKQI